MSKRVHTAQFAVASDGSVLLNVAEFDGEQTLELILERARRQKGPVFVGVRIVGWERAVLVQQMRDGGSETAARIVGSRQSDSARRGRPARRTRG